MVGFGFKVSMLNEEGKLVIDPLDAIRFVVAKPNMLIRIDHTHQTVVFQTSEDLGNHPLRNMLKTIANDFLMNFSYQIFGKKITPKGEELDVKRKKEQQAAVTESFGKMYGGAMTSYQPLDNVNIVVKHRKKVDPEVRGSRSRDIQSILIQRGPERFRMPINDLMAARAMARHVHNGGNVYDQVGTKICEMAQEYGNLKKFLRYVQSTRMIDESNQDYVELARESAREIRSMMTGLQKETTYAKNVDRILNEETPVDFDPELGPQDVESHFTRTQIDPRVQNAVPGVRRAAARRQAYRDRITNAVENAEFSGLKALLEADDEMMNFHNRRGRLSHQINKMSQATDNPDLSNYLKSVSAKLDQGESLNKFDYGNVKSCLVSAMNSPQQQPPTGGTSLNESIQRDFEDFLDRL